MTFDNLCTLTKRFSTSDQVDKSVCGKLAQAKAAAAKGNASERDAQLQAFRNIVDANRSRALTEHHADVLVRLSASVQ